MTGRRGHRTQALVSATALIIAACSDTSDTTSSSPSRPPVVCESNFTRDQFVGTWNEDSSPGIYTLNTDGTLVNGVLDEKLTGTWDFTKWSQTPGKPTPGEENACVLWLKINFRSGPMNLLYAPLSVSESTLKITYIGRGNTIVWNRANKA